jgi:hypothetical protein
MGAWKNILVHVAWSGLLVSGIPAAVLPLAAQQAGGAERQPAASSEQLVAQVDPVDLPDSPGAIAAKAAGQQTTGEQQSSTSASVEPAPGAQPAAPGTQPQSAPQRPVGTAAAEAPHASGIAASQPAGVAIAPAKQHRTRTIILRMGAIIGAGAAVGSVVALTAATPSKPPGAH